MKTVLKITKGINIVAVLFLLLGPYGIAITGALQVLAAILYLIMSPKNKLIYIYFGLVAMFFIFWQGDFNWLFSIPVFLIFFLTYIIHFQNKKIIKE
jgi:hypothetical protein